METILVLDDESLLLNLLCGLLQRHGFRTLKAGSAAEALRQFHDNHRQIDLLIADVSLPLDSGIQVALALRATLPGVPVILTSGYPASHWDARDSALLRKLGSDSVSILQKPFAPQTLLATIGEQIGRAQLEAARTA